MVLDRLDRYIARNVLAAIVVVQCVLLGWILPSPISMI